MGGPPGHLHAHRDFQPKRVDMHRENIERPEPAAEEFYRHTMGEMQRARLPFLVGGAYALAYYTGIFRHTKDLDLFVRPADSDRALAVLAKAGYRTEKTFPHWLGKAFFADDFIDIISSSGNGCCPVDDEWFARSKPGQVLGEQVVLCPAEKMIWQKAFVMERERFDGADIMHLIRARAHELDWEHLLRRFDTNWRVLLSHLVIFGFVYPAERTKVPRNVLERLTDRLAEEREDAPDGICRGTLLSRSQYLSDTERWGYADARLEPEGPMSRQDITRWTAAAFEEK
jgi:Uncharacterised nucleotidyltransferase